MNKKTQTFVTTAAFFGLPNVGKSTLLNALVGTKIAPTSRKPQTTRRMIRGIKTCGNYQQVYFDTPGFIEETTGLFLFMRKQVFSALENVLQVVAIVSAKDSIEKHLVFLKKLKKLADEKEKNFILVINKIDQLKEKSHLLQLINDYANAINVAEIIPISAQKKDGIKDLFEALNKKAYKGDFLFSSDLFTDASEKEIVAELIREKAMLELKEELPYRLAITIENFDESRREALKKPLITIDAILHVEKKSQKAIVIGKDGTTIKTIGMRARKDLEHLLNCQVMLKLFVKIEPNWVNLPKALRKLGY